MKSNNRIYDEIDPEQFKGLPYTTSVNIDMDIFIYIKQKYKSLRNFILHKYKEEKIKHNDKGKGDL